MENLNGALGFKATLDIDDFNVSAQAMERQIRNFSSSAISAVDDMEDGFREFAQKASNYITYYLVGQGMHNLLNSIVQTRGQFQQLEIAFETMLGSQSKAKKLMDEMVNTAAKTPFDLMGVAEGAKQLMAYGTSADKVNDTLVRLGNIASGLSIPLNDIVYLYGTTMVQGRLYAQDVRQFTGRGIPLVKELAEKYGVTAEKINEMVSAGKIGFKEVEEVLNKMTNAGGQFYNLMEKQSASLTGQISNLEDAWDTVLNDFGEKGQDIFSTAISGATCFVEHMDDVLRILKAITVAYGTYKAAVVLQTVLTKGYTGVSVIDNTVRSAKLALMKAEASLTGRNKAQTEAMTKAQEAHTAALESQLTAEQKANIVKQLRIATIQSLLTAQQQEYLSNLNLTATSEGYEAAALSVLTVDQQVALSKVDLSSKSAVYRAAIAQEAAANEQKKLALEQEIVAEREAAAASIAAMRVSVKEAAQKIESAKSTVLTANQKVEAARYELYWAQLSGKETTINTAKKKLEDAVDAQRIARQKALAAQSDFFTKKKNLEAAATLYSAKASQVDTTAKVAETTATTVLATATNKVTAAFKYLWATLKANPLGWLLTVVGLVVSAFTLFGDKSKENKNMMSEFGDEVNKDVKTLDLYFAVLKNTEKGTKAHKDALEAVNKLCQDYNKTLLEENDTLDKQKEKYNELKTAIQQTTAEKIKAKYVEEEYNKLSEKSDSNYDSFNTRLNYLQYNTGKKRKVKDKEGNEYEVNIQEAATHIQNMADDVKEMIRAMVEDGAKDLSGLTGDALKTNYNKLVTSIVNSTKEATGATDKEMASFKSQLTQYLDKQISSTQSYESAIDAIDKRIDKFLAPKDTSGLTDSVDYSKMSFEELDKKAEETQKAIDAINGKTVKVDADTTQLNNLLSVLKQIKGEIKTKTDNLDTEEGIQKRVKQLKDQRSKAKIGSQQYKDLDSQITTLEAKIPDHSKNKAQKAQKEAETAKKNAETYNQKQLEADRKLEEARISIMEEGYEKRKAQLDLQHKQALQQIDKEEKELEQARKKAGKGELTQEQKDSFTERRNLENKSYEKSQNNLFDGELDYKKKQYELYFRWVKNMGQDVADKQFSDLLNSGSSYKDYVEKEIAKLEQKRKDGTLTEGEGNQLITLNMQYDEITGAKSAMDTFRESVQRTISQAQTLAEKIDAVAKARELLNSGGSGLIGDDEKAQASLFLSEQEQQNEKDLQDEVLTQYRTYEEQKASIMQHYQLLMTEAQKMGDEERVNLIKKAQTEALSTLNTSFLQQTDSWKQLFNDIDYLSVGQLEKLVKDIEGQLPNLKLSPVDYKAVIDSLNKAKEEIIDKNPFKALATFYDDYIAAKKKLADAKAKMAEGTGSQSDVDAAEADVKKAAANITKSITKVTDIATSTASSLQSMFDALGMDDVADGIGTAIELMGQLGNAAGAVGQIMSGDIVGGVTGLISAATSLVSIFAGLHDSKYQKKIEKLQDQIDALERSYNRLERAFNNTYWVFTDEQREAYDKNIALINQQIAALEQQRKVAAASWNFAKYAELTAQIKDLNNQLSKAKEGDDMLGLYEQQKQALLKQQELIQQQIDAEKSKKKTDDDKIQSWQDDIDDITEQLEDLEQQMMETFAGTDVSTAIDDFADAIVDAFCAGEDAAEALAETTKSVLKNAVVQALKRQFLAKAINDAVEYLASAMEDGTLTDKEKENFEYMVNTAGETFKTALEGVGDWIKDLDDEDTDSLTGAVTSMSEETGGVIAGRLNAFIINQNEQTGVMREQLLYQAQIAQNTANSVEELKEIRATLKRIETKDSSLLSQGIS